jgi:hypothetical protein
MSITQKTTKSVKVESILSERPDVSVILAFAKELQEAIDQGLILPNARVEFYTGGSSNVVRMSVRESVTT